MKILNIIVCGLLLTATVARADCPAGISGYRNYVDGNVLSLKNIQSEDDGKIEFSIISGTNEHRFQFDGTTEVGKSSLSILLAAGMSGKEFSFHANGCNVIENGKTIVKNISIDF